ncbi:zinc-binding dehydrogenase [Thermomicrobium sp. 4228-Ro]|uniref:zinc-binding dehydrogenase n=1 Tax=Thermomicrobium sp. 4228-Ro TaxID=2993937 RepID=UPI0022496B85|nr:zinc-binding dehydrogenase [Thermomicrobium sp. 4228-Ro]MCX2728043.1 zinc-binding dehydrogenase [Thermomicrobium sp. 4228-Ro]
MRAARYFGPRDFRLVEVERPVPARGEVLLRVRAAGLCHSDLHIIFDELGGFPIPAPLTLGHEICGEAVELGEDVTGIEIGRRYAVFGPVGCGNCAYCRAGRDNLCTGSRWMGIARDGGYADYVAVPAQALVPVPDAVPDAVAAVATDAVLTSYHALLTVGRLQPGEGVAILGVGGLGLNAVQIASALGAVVLAVDIDERKLELARRHGAAVALDSRQLDPQQPPLDRPITLVADFVGNDQTKLLAQQLVARGGRVVLVGLASVGGPLLALRDISEEIAVLGSFWGTRAELATVLDVIARGLVRPRVETHPLEEILTWVERLRAGEVESRVALVP